MASIFPRRNLVNNLTEFNLLSQISNYATWLQNLLYNIYMYVCIYTHTAFYNQWHQLCAGKWWSFEHFLCNSHYWNTFPPFALNKILECFSLCPSVSLSLSPFIPQSLCPSLSLSHTHLYTNTTRKMSTGPSVLAESRKMSHNPISEFWTDNAFWCLMTWIEALPP